MAITLNFLWLVFFFGTAFYYNFCYNFGSHPSESMNRSVSGSAGSGASRQPIYAAQSKSKKECVRMSIDQVFFKRQIIVIRISE